MPAAGDQLLGLGEELDLADAAAADLDVVAFDRDLALAAKGLHLPLHVVDVGKRREIQMLAPDERRDLGEQRLAGVEIAGAGPRLDHGGALPGAPFPLVIMQRRFGRDRDLGRGRIRPQPQIDAEHVAVAGALLQQPRQRLREAHEERLRLDIRRERRRVADRRTRSGRCRWNSSARPRPSCPWRARSGRCPLPGDRDRAADAGRARLPGAADSAAPICTEATARSVSAAVTCITGQTPPMSHSAISSAASAFMRRSSCIASASPARGHTAREVSLDQRGEMRLRVARAESDQPRGIGAHRSNR